MPSAVCNRCKARWGVRQLADARCTDCGEPLRGEGPDDRDLIGFLRWRLGKPLAERIAETESALAAGPIGLWHDRLKGELARLEAISDQQETSA